MYRFTNDSTAPVDDDQLENLHAFILAINEINSQADILPNHHVSFVVRTSYATKSISTTQNTIDLINRNVQGVVGSLDNFKSVAASQLLNDANLVLSLSYAQGTEFGIGQDFPFKVSTVPIDSFKG